jgi:hypothetical protein
MGHSGLVLPPCGNVAGIPRKARETERSVRALHFQDDGKCIKPTTTDQFREFLRRPAFCGAFDDDSVARSFVNGVRNGIFHEAETRGWVIWREEPPGQILVLEDGRYALNRTEFYHALKAEFDGYVAELRDPNNSELRTRFKKKMSDIVKAAARRAPR